MGTLRVIAPDGTTSDIGYDGRTEPPLETLQRAVGGYVEHIAVTYAGKRRSAYVIDPWGAHPALPRFDPQQLPLNAAASRLVGQKIVGPLVIDLGRAP